MILSHQTFGEKNQKEILILHGLFGSKRNWFSIAKAIAIFGYKVWVLDLRNHGDSEWSENHTYFDLAYDVHNFLRENNIKDACLMGHSMGGKAAMLFDLVYPNLLSKLIIVDIAPVKYFSPFGRYLEVLRSIDLHSFNKRSEVNEKISTQIDDANIRSFLLQNITVNQEGVLKWRINIKALIENSLEISDFPDIQVNSSTKTLFLFGSNSEYSVSSQKDYIKKLFLSASFKEIKGAGHWVQAEKPKDFLEIVSNFLKSNYSKN
tara:strand:- start:1421 stop:2209 length:789 start_codon:yes stop_codon:yes gene_type:complete